MRHGQQRQRALQRARMRWSSSSAAGLPCLSASSRSSACTRSRASCMAHQASPVIGWAPLRHLDIHVVHAPPRLNGKGYHQQFVRA